MIFDDLHPSLIKMKSREGLKILCAWSEVLVYLLTSSVSSLCLQRIIGQLLLTIGPIWKFIITIANFTIQVSRDDWHYGEGGAAIKPSQTQYHSDQIRKTDSQLSTSQEYWDEKHFQWKYLYILVCTITQTKREDLVYW